MASKAVWSRVARLRAPPRLVSASALGRAPAAGPCCARPARHLLAPFRCTHDMSRPPSSSSPSSASASASSTSSTSSPSSPSSPSPPSPPSAPSPPDDAGLAPAYELTFTCVPCGTRSAHRVSKQGYHQGSVLITCPSCRNRHVISDHLGIFGTAKGAPRTVEDILREQGRLVKKGTLGEDGDLEFWEDGSSNSRQTRLESEDVLLPSTNKKPAEGDPDAAPGSTFAKR